MNHDLNIRKTIDRVYIISCRRSAKVSGRWREMGAVGRIGCKVGLEGEFTRFGVVSKTKGYIIYSGDGGYVRRCCRERGGID